MTLNPKLWIRACEDLWFDRTRHVDTSGMLPQPHPSQVLGEMLDSNIYGPVRSRSARQAISSLPLRDLSQYTFVDIGAGKGRALFIAAEYPFRRVLGVEYSPDLNAAALENIGKYRSSARRAERIDSIAANAADFEFPDGNLVLFLFNPFGAEILRLMLANLQRSLERNPRHVLLLMIWPEHGDVVAQTPGIRTLTQNSRFHIYETGTPPNA